MPGESTHYKFKYAEAADETKAFPAEVSEPATKKIDKELWEGNKVAAGEVYSAPAARAETPAEFEPSATRAALVIVECNKAESTRIAVEVGAIEIGKIGTTAVGTIASTITFIVPAGGKWKWRKLLGAPTVTSTYLLL